MMAAFIDQTKGVGLDNPLVKLTTQEEFSILSPKLQPSFRGTTNGAAFGVEGGLLLSIAERSAG